MKTVISGLIFLAISIGCIPFASTEPYAGSDIVLAGKDYINISAINAVDPHMHDGYGWFTKKSAIYTKWQDEWVEYQAYLPAGLWRIGLNVENIGTNRGDPNWYTQFQFKMQVSGQPEIIMKAPASDEEQTYGYTDIQLPDGTYSIKFTWINDKNDPATGRDANLQINTFFCDRIGEYTPPAPPEDDDSGGGGGCWVRTLRQR